MSVPLLEILKEMSCLNVEILENLYFEYMQYINNFS